MFVSIAVVIGSLKMELRLRGDNGGDEELGAVGVATSVGHGEETLLGVLELEVLILEAVTVD